MGEGTTTEARMLMPHEYAVAWHLALITERAEDATAAEVYEQGFEHGRPSYQQWTPQKVAVVLTGLLRRGLVANSGSTDAWLPGKQARRWRLTGNGHRWLRGEGVPPDRERGSRG
jgi:hypothetical protein